MFNFVFILVYMRNGNGLLVYMAALLALLLGGCAGTRHVADNQFLLDKVSIEVNDTSQILNKTELMTYVRNQPNHKMLWSAKVRLGIYDLSGKDSTKWYNKWLRKMGESPVIYSRLSTLYDADQLQKALINKGFLKAKVEIDTLPFPEKRKMEVTYNLIPGEPYILNSIEKIYENDSVRKIVESDSSRFLLRPGDLLDRSRLEEQRELITSHMRNRGYYGFSKDLISFNADTTEGSHLVDLTMSITENRRGESGDKTIASRKFIVHNVYYITDYDGMAGSSSGKFVASDTVNFKNLTIYYRGKKYLRPSVLYDNCFISPGSPYSQASVDRTYQALSRLSILKFVNIQFRPVGDIADTELLDAYIMLTPAKSQSFQVELEGTNSEGDLGFAVSVGYTHRNVGKGSETLNAKVRGAYEAIGGNLDGLIHNRYMEYSADVAITFPKFKAPFLHESFKRKIKAVTEFNVSLNYQERPEYTRIISTAGWAYKWQERFHNTRHTFTPIDINYVYLPESTNDFIDQIAPDNPLLRYSYEDHFIMRMGYSFYHSNKRQERPWERDRQRNIYTVRVNAEFAGNLLFLLSSIFDHRSNFHTNPYKVFGIRYSQYFKAESDYTLVHSFDARNSVAFHAGFGIGVPYGNSSILPFEKRFYGGGANGVRGWSVRTLGPGSYPGQNTQSDFINQCGDIRIDLNAEYRAKLFWVVELGAFIDVGNIWTIHNYENQPGGMFHFNTFYKQLAGAYGLGLRLDFDYFLLRVDLGMKAHNPAMGEEPWPLIHPRWHRDSSFHFSIGYPF